MISSLSLNQLLALYSWFPLAALLVFLLLIARFYEQFSGKRMMYGLFIVPLILFGVAAVRYASIEGIAGDEWADVALGVGGTVLLALCAMLYWRMLRAQRDRLKDRS
ncbi:MAG: hypothetical protein H7Y11_00950 [Armatimonadetes bacterium]|nr:hypothetical protein [Anaerolineae bacterium]